MPGSTSRRVTSSIPCRRRRRGTRTISRSGPTAPGRGGVAVGRQLGPKTFLVLNAGFCEGRQVGVRNTLGLSLQFRISPEWRTEASFEPVQTCADPSTESQGGTVPRQVGLDLFWEKRY